MLTHKSRRHMPFRTICLLQGIAVAAAVDYLLVRQMARVLGWHAQSLGWLLNLANVPWKSGGVLRLWPGVSADIFSTDYLNYAVHPYYPGLIALAALVAYGVAYRRVSDPLKLLLFLPVAALGIAFTFLLFQHRSPYSPMEFSAVWYRGEVFLWLLLPVIFAMSFFILNVPLPQKIGWLLVLLAYSFVWSAVRLATALATFHYFGSVWMPFFYFIFGIMADFLYIVAAYSLAMDGAARYLAAQQEAWV